MYRSFILFTLILFISCAENKTVENQDDSSLEKTTTYYLIRHAEKDRTNPRDKDPILTEKGLLRAEKWASIFSEIELDAIYSSDFKRTQQTAKPISDLKNLPVINYYPKKNNHSQFIETIEGSHVLIVGHSNTTPKLANFILKENRYEEIPDSINGRLYILTKQGEKVSSLILNLE